MWWKTNKWKVLLPAAAVLLLAAAFWLGGSSDPKPTAPAQTGLSSAVPAQTPAPVLKAAPSPAPSKSAKKYKSASLAHPCGVSCPGSLFHPGAGRAHSSAYTGQRA